MTSEVSIRGGPKVKILNLGGGHKKKNFAETTSATSFLFVLCPVTRLHVSMVDIGLVALIAKVQEYVYITNVELGA